MTDQIIAHHFPASPNAVTRLLGAPAEGGTFFDHEEGHFIKVDAGDTRSGWKWFRLANGDLILGFYPQGDWGYFGSETAVENDFNSAELAGTVSALTADVDDMMFA